MRIVIDMQGVQSESRTRGIGRYSMSIALAIVRQAGQHEVWLVLNSHFTESILNVRQMFAGLVPPERIRVFDVPVSVAEHAPANVWRYRAAEKIREYFIQQLQPDVVLVTSLFEGYVDATVTSVGEFSDGTNTAVILYDLIPLLNPSTYLVTSCKKQHYERKIQSLKNAGLLLAISDYTRREAIQALNLEPDKVVNISAAVDACFKPINLPPQKAEELRQCFGITRKIVLYAPGGFDARKNVDGLITAYSLLSVELRADHQLVIVSKLDDVERSQLRKMCIQTGLAADELVLTGYITDHDLVAMYSEAVLSIFPSRHEGFGLPALEAMACGTPVIGSDSTSIPEVIGYADALFDTSSPQSIADKMEQVLRDEQFRKQLSEYGLERAKIFSWDESARRALRALETHMLAISRPASDCPKTLKSKKPRLAFVSPLPPESTGIADYSAELLSELLHYFEIELVTDQAEVTLPLSLATLPQRSVSWFSANGDIYDRVLYQLGNSPFHSHMVKLLSQYPGLVVLHDFFLSGMLVHEEILGAMPGVWTEALYQSHGYSAVQARFKSDSFEEVKNYYPCNLQVLQNAKGNIVHSEYSLQLAQQWSGVHAVPGWTLIPLLRNTPAIVDRAAARKALGISEDAFVVCSFGFVDPVKLTHRLLEVWLSSRLSADPRCELVFVGKNHGGDYGIQLSASIRNSECQDRLRITGWIDAAIYQQYLQAADVGVQLRDSSRGETSAAALDCMNYGLPTIVNANGSMADFPVDVVWRLPDVFTDIELATALESLWDDEAKRMQIGARARQLIQTKHNPSQCAKQYVDAIEAAYADAHLDQRALIKSLVRIPGIPTSDHVFKQLAQSIAASTAQRSGSCQLLVDISTITHSDLKTGIERVVRAQLLELIKSPPLGFRVEPVYLSNKSGAWHYRYARQFTCMILGIPSADLPDAPIDICFGDVLYVLDFAPIELVQASKAGVFLNLRALGIQLNVLVYDLLPILRPEFFPQDANAIHTAWLREITGFADRLIGISSSVADELRLWLEQNRPLRTQPLEIYSVPLGSDIAASAPTVGLPANASNLLLRLEQAISFLMVGTIEPRKGHLQTLGAFEQMWSDGYQVCLVIVGKEGWASLPQNQRRTIPGIVDKIHKHPELGKRLFWLQETSDQYLQEVYAACTCLLAGSEGEGFGLPLIEAARYKLPIIARDIPVFREIAGDHAYYFRGLEPEILADTVSSWLTLRQRGTMPRSEGMHRLSWRESALELQKKLGLNEPPRFS